jgi:membrane protein
VLGWLSRTYTLIGDSLNTWVEQRAASKGAALAFYALLSMTPILVLAVALAGFFFGAEAAQGEIMLQMQGLAGSHAAQAIQTLLAAARDPAAGLVATALASAVLLVGATSVFCELKGSLDELWGIPKAGRSILGTLMRTRLLAFGLVLVLAFLLLVSLLVSVLLAVLERYAGGIWTGSGVAFSAASSLISFGVIAFLFAVIYKMLPDVLLSWGDVCSGAMFTAGLFSLGKYAIGLYLGSSAVATPFGAAGSVVALLVWVYYSAQIFFLGAYFTREYALTYGSRRQLPATGPVAFRPLSGTA